MPFDEWTLVRVHFDGTTEAEPTDRIDAVWGDSKTWRQVLSLPSLYVKEWIYPEFRPEYDQYRIYVRHNHGG